MSQTSRIREYIEILPRAYVFTSRELLTVANRGSVDTFVSNHAKNGFLERVARGMYRVAMPENVAVSPLQAAATKLRAFGKEIVTISIDDSKKSTLECAEKVLVVGTNGRSSQFRFGEWLIVCRGLGPRKIRLAQRESGKQLRNLWLVGENNLCDEQAKEYLTAIPRREFKRLPQMHKYIPQWLSEIVSTYFSERLVLSAG